MISLTDNEKKAYIYGYLFSRFESDRNVSVDEFVQILGSVANSVNLFIDDEFINKAMDFHEQLHNIVVEGA